MHKKGETTQTVSCRVYIQTFHTLNPRKLLTAWTRFCSRLCLHSAALQGRLQDRTAMNRADGHEQTAPSVGRQRVQLLRTTPAPSTLETCSYTGKKPPTDPRIQLAFGSPVPSRSSSASLIRTELHICPGSAESSLRSCYRTQSSGGF